MNKKQLVAKLAGSLSQSKADAERTFDTITNTILDALKNDDSVKIAGFGTYKVAKRKARIGRNPRTCLLYTSPSPRDKRQSRMPSSA